MKKVLILALIMLTSTLSFGQGDFNKWAVSGEFGVHAVSDQSALVTDMFNHYGVGVRYNINEIVGVGLRGGLDNIHLETIEGDYVNMDYKRVNMEASISLFEILRLRHKNINFLLHGGPGIAFVDTNTGYEGRMMNVTGGMTALVKLSSSLAFQIDYTSSVHLSQDRTLDGAFDINNAGINSVVDNLSAGFVVYFGKKNREHADWYVPEPIEPIVPVINNITQVTEVREITKVVEQKCDCIIREFVFFEHDKFEVLQSERNSITQIVKYLTDNPDAKLLINGYASPTKSSADYNLELSSKRINAVVAKLELMGIPSSRIKTFAGGKDFNYSDEDIQEMGRRVELIIE
jgi:outer membrane protein OmpA-like peptidoglycan-associated protein